MRKTYPKTADKYFVSMAKIWEKYFKDRNASDRNKELTHLRHVYADYLNATGEFTREEIEQ